MASSAKQATKGEWYAKRAARAASENVTMTIVGPDTFAMEGDSGNAHLVETSGSEATHCTCPDYEHNLTGDQKCKHMIAYEECEYDEVEVTG